MKVTVNEITEITNTINKATKAAYEQGVRDESERNLPNNLYDALVEYGLKSKTLVGNHKSTETLDGCNWIQLIPTREGSEGVEYIEISFESNLMEIHHIGTKTK